VHKKSDRESQLAVETLLDSEGLTDDLRDEAAKRLLNWGIAQAERLAAAATDADRTVGTLRRLIRRVNNLVAQQSRLTDDEFAAEVDDLTTFAAERLGFRTPKGITARSLLAEREAMGEAQMVDRLTALLQPEQSQEGIPSDRVGNIDGPAAAWAITCHAEGDEEPTP
jgi:hypothetical protein